MAEVRRLRRRGITLDSLSTRHDNCNMAAKKERETTERDANWAHKWPSPAKSGQSFYHAGLEPSVVEILRRKGYDPVDFRTLEGEEKLEAMLNAALNGVYDPDTSQTKMLELHMKQLNNKEEMPENTNAAPVKSFLDTLATIASKKMPDWRKSKDWAKMAKGTVLEKTQNDPEYDPYFSADEPAADAQSRITPAAQSLSPKDEIMQSIFGAADDEEEN